LKLRQAMTTIAELPQEVHSIRNSAHVEEELPQVSPPQCPAGHTLAFTKAAAGICDGCQKPVAKGAMVMDCAQCNWYLCSTCYPHRRITECPKAHKLQQWASQSMGKCDGCAKVVARGEVVMDCRQCDWYVCNACRDGGKTSTANVLLYQIIASLPTTVSVQWSPKLGSQELRQCPAGHPLKPCPAVAAGVCDGCGRPILANQMVMDCRSCNWYLCTMCHG